MNNFKVIESAKSSYVSVWENRIDWAKIAVMPLCAILITTILMTQGVPYMGLVQFVIGIVFTIASFRYVIKGQKIEHWAYWSWDMDAWRMVGYMILVGIVASLGIVLAAFVFFAFAGDFLQKNNPGMIEYLSLAIGVIGLFAIALYLGGRLFLLTASIAVSDPKPITKTWSLLDGFKSYKVLWTYLLTLLPFIIINIFTVSQLFSGIDWSALLSSAQNAEEFVEHSQIITETINYNTLLTLWYSVPLSIIGACISSQLLGDIYKKLNG